MLHWFPENISTYGAEIDRVFELIYVIVGIWFLAVVAILFYFLIRYRRRAGVSAHYEAGRSWKALAWVLVPAFLVLLFDLWIDLVQGPVWSAVKLDLPVAEVTVRVTGRQFVWDFAYSGPDGQFDTPDDILTQNQMGVPVNRVIRFELGAADVIHSLWIPNLRLKQDAVPGRVIRGWFQATREGTFPIACAELCGSGHGVMKGELKVMNDEDFERWLKENAPAP